MFLEDSGDTPLWLWEPVEVWAAPRELWELWDGLGDLWESPWRLYTLKLPITRISGLYVIKNFLDSFA